MPGIFGLISSSGDDRAAIVKAMLSTLDREKFYCSGTEFAPEFNCFAGWVAHKTSSAEGQPFKSEDGNVSVLLSGECFSDLPAGAPEKSSRPGGAAGSFIAELYVKLGDQMFEHLNGMFSGLLIDKREGKVILFNDRYGTERIYWHEAADALYFASEAKALLRVLPALRQFDEQGVAQLLTFGCTVGGRTLFRGVEILPGGSRWIFQNGVRKKERYFDRQAWETLPSLAADSFQEHFDETFKRIVPRYFTSDAKLGIALTGGLDTRMIVACAPPNIKRCVSYTFTGAVGETFDDRVASDVAKVAGLEHRLLRLGQDFFTDFARHADETVYVTDGTFGITGTHEIYLNRLARELAPVRLTGLFGSEILRGVSYCKPSLPPAPLLNPEFAFIVKAVADDSAAEQVHPVTSAAFRTVPWNLFGSMAASRSQVVLRTPYLDNELVALAYQTPIALRKSPEVGLRMINDSNPLLGRVPTDRLVEDKSTAFPRKLKWLFREAGFKLDYYYNEGMPDSLCRFDPIFDTIDNHIRIFGRHKFLHYRRWFRQELAPYVIEVLSDLQGQSGRFFDRTFLCHMAKAHTNGYGNHVRSINAVLTLEAVERLLFRELPSSSDLNFPRSSALIVSS